jgi:hypothetical protein
MLVAHCHLGLGKLSRRTDKREQARDHLTTATTMYREMDMRFWLEQAEAELGAKRGSERTFPPSIATHHRPGRRPSARGRAVTLRRSPAWGCRGWRCRCDLSLAFAASIVGDGIGGRPGQQDWIGREIDAVRPVGGVEDQAPLVDCARRGNTGDFQAPQLDQGPTLRPEGGDVVRCVASSANCSSNRNATGPVRSRSSSSSRRKFEFRFPPSSGGEKGLACLRHKAIAAESGCAILCGEAEGVLGMVDRLRIAGRHGLLHQALDEGAPGGMASEKAWHCIGVGSAAGRVGELSPQELEQLLGRPRDEPFDGVSALLPSGS